MAITPRILYLSNLFRQQLLARERRAATVMARYYGEIWRGLQGDIFALSAEVTRLQAAGEEFSPDKIYRLQRLQAMQRRAEEELARFSQIAGDTIAAGQRESIAAGERQAYQLTLAGFPPGADIAVTFSRLPTEAVESLVGFLADGSPLVDVIRKYAGDAVEAFGQTMARGLASGWNPRKLARALRQQFGMGLTNSLVLARTEQLRAYRTATLHSYQESGVVKGWERHAALDDRTCMACIALDGTRYTTKEAMDDHPQGRCAMLPITPTWAELGIDAPEPDFSRQLGQEWFVQQDEATQRRMMGNAKWEAWQRGEFELDDLPKLIESDLWGGSWVPKSLRELVGGTPPTQQGGPRAIPETELQLQRELSEARAAYEAALASGDTYEADGIKGYMDAVENNLRQQRGMNDALWQELAIAPDQATPEDWRRVAESLKRDGYELYKKYTKEGISLFVQEQRGAQLGGYMSVGKDIVQVREGAFSRRDAMRMEGELWAGAKRELTGMVGDLLEQAGFSAGDIAAANYEQRVKLLEELGNMELGRTAAGRPRKIDAVPESARDKAVGTVDYDLAAICGHSATDILSLPTLDAWSKMELSDLILSVFGGM